MGFDFTKLNITVDPCAFNIIFVNARIYIVCFPLVISPLSDTFIIVINSNARNFPLYTILYSDNRGANLTGNVSHCRHSKNGHAKE